MTSAIGRPMTMDSWSTLRRDEQAIRDELERAGVQAWKGRNCCCPFHDDKDPSAGIYEKEGVWRFKCQACGVGGDVFDIKALVDKIPLAEALKQGHRMPQDQRSQAKATARPSKPKRHYATPKQAFDAIANREVATFVGSWTYPGDVLRVGRFDKGENFDTGKMEKTFRPVSRDGDGWIEGDPPGLLPLYRGDEIPTAGPVVVVEGEKCADAAREIGLAAITSAHGSKSAGKSDWKDLAGRDVLILPDNDDPGRKYARDAAAILAELTPPATVKIIELPGLADHGDLVDWTAADGPMGDKGGDEIRDAILGMADAVEAWTPPATTATQSPPARATLTKAEQSPCEILPGVHRFDDCGNSDRLVHCFGNVIRWCDPWSCWLVWSGRHWERDDGRRIDAISRGVLVAMFAEASAAEGDLQKAAAKWAASSCSAFRLRAMIDLARCFVPVRPHELDQGPMLLNVGNGTIDLTTGELRPHDPADLITQIIDVRFDPAATCPRWDRFLLEVFGGDAELVAYVQRLIGYSLTGDGREHILPVCYGSGSNGKSTLLDTILGLLGDYGHQAPTSLLMAGPIDGHPTEIASLFGKRLAVASETESGRKLRASLVKGLTGDATITARRMRENFWTFKRTAKIWLCTNHKPTVPDDTEAMWRRLRLIPFDQTFRGKAQDQLLPEKLKAERPGILAWAVRGCLDWQRSGLGEPQAVMAATEEYRHDEDTVGSFVEERLNLDMPGHATPTGRIRAAYEAWCKDGGESPISSRQLNEQLRRHGLEQAVRRVEGRNTKVWIGVLLAAEAQE